MTRKLCVAGCSFSDYTQVDRVYGEHLAEKLQFDYLHEAAGCGSNWRIWRRVVGNVLNGNVGPNDIVIIQYTNPERREFFSKNKPFEHVVDPSVKIRTVEPYDDGSLIRYKFNSHTWQDYDNENDFFKAYEDNHISIVYERELFNAHHEMFQSFMKEKNINVIFINGRYIKNNKISINYNDKYKPFIFNENMAVMMDDKYRLLPDDLGHMSEEGHKKFSELLYDHIKTINLI